MREGRKRGPLRRLTRLAFGVALALAVGCHGKPGASEGAAPAQPPAPAPAGLLAEVTLASPDVTWQRLQRGIGGGAGILPSTLGGMICSLSGVDPRLGAEINGGSPAYLVVAGDLASPSWLIAARLVDERRARPLLERPASAGAVAAIAPGGWLVVARSAADVADLAPYVTRTLPSRHAPLNVTEAIAIDVPQSALAGPIASAAQRAWSDAEEKLLADDRALRAQHGGRAPDFGDPRAIVGALGGWTQRKIAALRDLRGAHVAIDVSNDDVSAVLTAAPASPDGAAHAMLAALHPGDLAPLLAAPRDALVTLLVRDAAETREADAAALEATLAATLGPRLLAPDAKRVHAAIDDWTRGRGAGDWAALSLVFGQDHLGAVAEVAATDPARASRGLREGLDAIAHAPALRDPLATWLHVRDIVVTSPELAGGDHATMATFSTDRASSSAASPAASTASSPASSPAMALAWATGPGGIKLALATAPLPMLAAPVPGSTLADDPAMRAILDPIGAVADVVALQPGRAPGCAAAGGVVLGWGARPQDGEVALWVRLAASDPAIRCLGRALF